MYVGVLGHPLGDGRLRENPLPQRVENRGPSGERVAGIVSGSVQILI